MSAHSGGATPALSVRLRGYGFAFVASLIPERDATRAIKEFHPQGRYAKRDMVPLHKHGNGPFCSFRISVAKGRAGVYALVVDEDVCYIGECEDVAKQVNTGHGHISPANCYEGGRVTNCKINRRVLDVSKAGGRVDLYFHPTRQRQAVKKHLVAMCLPPWNGGR